MDLMFVFVGLEEMRGTFSGYFVRPESQKLNQIGRDLEFIQSLYLGTTLVVHRPRIIPDFYFGYQQFP